VQLSLKQPHTSSNLIPGLDALRYFAALSVIFTHLGSWNLFGTLGIQRYHGLISGNTGVTLFYTLSGFLITTLAIREQRDTDHFSLKNFFVRRALRIFPLYYLALGCYLLFTIFGWQRASPPSLAHAATYTYNFIPNSQYQSWLGSFHTLATEEHFYLIFPFLFLLLYRRAGWLLMIFIFAYLYCAPATRSWFSGYESTYSVNRWTMYACPPILIGSLVACIYSHHLAQAALNWICLRETWRRILQIGLLGTFVLFYSRQVDSTDPITASWGFAFLLIFFAQFRASLASRALSFPPLAYLGKISYGLYVWQSFVCSTGSSERLVSNPWLAFVLVFVLAILSYELFEKYFLKLKHRIGDRTLHNSHALPV
jgi:peptidoglycan/LPS O-acetylase OafA/YrhL